MSFFSHLFWPRPPVVGYDDLKMQIILLICFGLIVTSFVLKRWRKKQSNAVTRKLSRSWRGAALWFGLIGLILAVSRAEDISYLSMRFWWVVWVCILALYLFIQIRTFRTRHYSKLPSEHQDDPREKYLPRKKKRK